MTIVPVVASGVAFVVYLRTLLPGIAFGDWGEMQTVPHVLGVAHPTGYPTYILLAWVFELLPIGPVAFRANLLSAVLVAAAVGVTSLISLRLGVRPALSLVSALALAAVGTVWAAATVAEVNPLHLLFAALLIQWALVWEAGRRPRDLAVGGLLVGLALGNHLLTLFVAPFIGLFVLWVGRGEIRARLQMLLPAMGALVLGLATYLYIPLAAAQSPPLPYNHPLTLDAVVWLVSGEQFRGQFGGALSWNGLGEFLAALPDLWMLLAAKGTPILPALGLVGLAVLVRRRPPFGMMCAAILVSGGYVWANYLRLEHYLLVPWLILSVGAAVGLETIVSMLTRWTGRFAAFDAGTVVGAAATVLAAGLALANFATSDRSGDRSGSDYVEAVFAALPAQAAILSVWDASTPLWHGQHVQGLRPDILIVDDTNIVYEGWGTRERRIESLVCDRPVFILRLSDQDLVPTAREFALEPVMTVRVALGGPSAAVTRPIHRVEPLDATACGA
jgi:hypothetical protein